MTAGTTSTTISNLARAKVAAGTLGQVVMNDSGTGALTSIGCANGEVIKFNGSGVAICATDNSGIAGSGTTNYIAKFSAATSVTDSAISDNGTTVAIANRNFTVTGQAVSNAVDAGAATVFNFNSGNLQHTTASCAAMTLSNMVDGGSYTVVVKGTTSGTCVFSHAGLVFHYFPVNAATTNGTQSVYTMLRAGNDVYVTWITGF